MQGYRALGSQRDFKCEEIEFEALRLEAFSVKLGFSSFAEAVGVAVNEVKRYLTAAFSPLLSLQIENDIHAGSYILYLLAQRTKLRNHYMPPNSTQATTSTMDSYLLTPMRETRHALLSQAKEGVVKEYRGLTCESVNRALAEAVILLNVDGKKGRLLGEIQFYGSGREDKIRLFMKMGGKTIREDIALRRKQMNYYSEELLVQYLASIACTLNSVHTKVSLIQGSGHGSLTPACIMIEGEEVTGIDGFGVSRLGRVSLDFASQVYACPEWRDIQLEDVQAADVYALGMVLLHMTRLWLPCDCYTSNVSRSQSIASSLSQINNYSQDFKVLLTALLSDRMTTKDVLTRTSRLLPAPIRLNPGFRL